MKQNVVLDLVDFVDVDFEFLKGIFEMDYYYFSEVEVADVEMVSRHFPLME